MGQVGENVDCIKRNSFKILVINKNNLGPFSVGNLYKTQSIK